MAGEDLKLKRGEMSVVQNEASGKTGDLETLNEQSVFKQKKL